MSQLLNELATSYGLAGEALEQLQANEDDLRTATSRTRHAQSLLGGIIDFVSRPEYASANIAEYLTEQHPDIFSLDTAQNVASLAWQGLSGEKKMTYDQLIERNFPQWGKGKQFAVSLASAILFDPTTYIPAKWLAKPGELVLKGAGKLAKPLEATKLGKAFIPGAGTPEAYKLFRAERHSAIRATSEEIFHEIRELNKGLKKSDRELLSAARQNPAVELPARLQNKLTEIGGRFDDLIDDAYGRDLVTHSQWLNWKGREGTYLPGIYEHSRQLSSKLPPRWVNQKPNFLRAKKFETLDDAQKLADDFTALSTAKSVDEMREMALSRGIDFDSAFAAAEDLPLEAFTSQAAAYAKRYTPEKDILKLYAMRKFEQEVWASRRAFVDDAVEYFGRKIPWDTKVLPKDEGLYFPIGRLRFFAKDMVDPTSKAVLETLLDKFDEAGEGLMYMTDDIRDMLLEVSKTMPSITRRVPTYALPKSIADDMNRSMRFLSGDDVTNAFMKYLYDVPLSWWRLGATALRVPFHIRNAYSNVFQSFLGGLSNPKRFYEAATIQKAVAFGDEATFKLGQYVFDTDTLRRTLNRSGIRGRGWIGSDVQRSALREFEWILEGGTFGADVGRAAKHPLKTVTRSGRNIGLIIEDNARIALFADQLKKGATIPEAARQVRKYLFDYGELTQFERDVMRRFMPFYTWTRKNLPLQIEALLTQPKKYQQYAKVLRAYDEPETASEMANKKPYYDKMMYRKTSWKTSNGTPIYAALDLPPLEFNRIADPANMAGSLTPYKVLIELAMNMKTFPQIHELSRFPGDMARAPVWAQALPDKVIKQFEKWKVLRPILDGETGKMVLGMNKKVLHFMHSAFPMLNEMARVNAVPITLEDERPEMWKRSYISGVSQKALKTDREQRDLHYQAIDLQEYINQYTRLFVQPPTKDEIKAFMEEQGMTLQNIITPQ